MNKRKVLVGGPVYQKPEILDAFLSSLKKLERNSVTIDYVFVDDNADAESRELLASFKRDSSSVLILPGKSPAPYLCDQETHHWNDGLMLKVANYKNAIITYAIANAYDYLFLVDSDLVLHPNLLEHLKGKKKEIVSELVWSPKILDQLPQPNVWMFDGCDLTPRKPGEELDQIEIEKRRAGFLEGLNVSGLYEVGGLGACTLIKRSALLKGVGFSPIKNLSFHRDDCFFSVRAATLGIDLFVDTRYPAYHIYREDDLEEVSDYINQCGRSHSFIRQYKRQGNRITLSMVVRNEEGRYLSRVLESVVGHIDDAVIIDDASTDDTVAICERILQGIPLRIVRNNEPIFSNGIKLRRKQWQETLKMEPDWILNLDADEILEEGFWVDAQELINSPDHDLCCFRMYDMWDETNYREDPLWNTHKNSRAFLLRYQPDYQYEWHRTAQRCGRFPANIESFSKIESDFRIQHYGWAKVEDRLEKQKRYLLLDPDDASGLRKKFDSISDEDPHLLAWK